MSSAQSSAGTTNYVYNALGQLVEKSGNGGTILLVYDEAGHILGEYTSTGALVQETIWMGDTPVATLRPNGTSIAIYYVHTDHLGTPRKVTRPSDNGLMWRYDPDTYGASTTAANSNPAGLGTFVYNLRFPGQYFLAESGLSYNYFRTYDPAVGRYLESDPIGLRGGSPSTYAYTNSNPISLTDRFGLSSVIYNPSTGNLTVVNGAGQAVGTFDAGNNAQSGSRGPWPTGDYSFAYHTAHPDDAVNSPFGSNGNYVFNVPGCVGCGIHSGRAFSTDRAGRSGVKFATNGCIRTTDAATELISQLTAAGDPLTGLTVSSAPVPTNLPSIDPALSGAPAVYLPDY